MYRVYDLKLRLLLGTVYVTRRRATNRAEKLNLEYGAHRFSVVSSLVWDKL